MNLKTVKKEIATAVKANVVSPVGTPGLETFGYCPDLVPEPCFYVGEAEIEPHRTFAGSADARLTCRLLVGKGEDEAAQGLLDEYLSDTGTASVLVALEKARGAPGQLALNGAADDVMVERITGYRMYEHADKRYFGAEIIVKVIGS